MTTHPSWASPSTKIRDVLELLIELKVRHCPICEDGKLVGIISDRDIRDYSFPVDEELFEKGHERARLDGEVGEIMITEVLSVLDTAPLVEIIDMILVERIGAVPVTSVDGETLIGIVSTYDVLKAARGELC